MDTSQRDIDECCLRVAAYYGERLNHLNKQQIGSLNKALDNCFKRHCFKANGPTNDELEGFGRCGCNKGAVEKAMKAKSR